MCVEATSALSGSETPVRELSPSDDLEHSIRSFATYYEATINEWHETLLQMRKNGDRVAVWGAGSKGVTFLNCIGSSNAVDYVVDINPNKAGLYVSGTGHEILGIDQLSERPPTQVIIMNPVYKREIEGILSDAGISANVHCA